MLVKNEITGDKCQGPDSAIDTTMDAVRNTANEICNLAQLSKDETYTIQYAYLIATDWEPSEMFQSPIGHGGAQDDRQKLVGVAEYPFHLIQMHAGEFRRLRNIQGRFTNWMTGIGATAQLPGGWAK